MFLAWNSFFLYIHFFKHECLARCCMSTLLFIVSLFALASAPPQAQDTGSVSVSTNYIATNFDHLLGIDGFSDKLMLQHFELYKGYVAQTNQLNLLLHNLLNSPDMSAAEYSALKKAYAFEFNGMKLHELFFDNLDKASAVNTESALYQKIVESFSSYEMWQKDFIQTGLSRGIGWVMCFYDKTSKKLINTWIESHDKGTPIFDQIILIMDVWEHAYLQDYGIKRKDYIQTFMKHINWAKAEQRFLEVTDKSKAQ